MRQTQCSRILATLRQSDITSAFMIDELRIFKYSSRIADLRAKGYTIKATHINKSLWSYHLVQDQPIAKPDLLSKAIGYDPQKLLDIEPIKRFTI